LLTIVANEVLNIFNSHIFVTTDEKFMLVRVLPLLLYLMDGAFKVSDKHYLYEDKLEKIKIPPFSPLWLSMPNDIPSLDALFVKGKRKYSVGKKEHILIIRIFKKNNLTL
jgi:Tfp pilus assembly protein PilZ